MDGVNRVTLLGNLCADPELRFGQGADQAVLRIRVACNQSYFDKKANERKESVEYISATVFGKRAEALQKILTKGAPVYIEGRIHNSSYEKDGQKIYRTDVIVNEIILTGGRRDGADRGGQQQPAPRQQQQQQQQQQSAPASSGGGGEQFGGDEADNGDVPF